MDDMRLYGRALTASEVLADMSTPVGNGGSTPADTAAPSTPMSLTASGITTSQATLSWQASIDNMGVSGYRVYRDGAFVGTTSATTFTNAGLAANTSYAFTVAAFDSAGNTSPQSAPRSVTTASGGGADTTPPSTPTGVTATNVTASSITLSWQASTDNIGVLGYKIFRDGALADTTTSTTLAQTGLAANTTYVFNVAAVDAAGNVSGVSPSYSVTTAGGADTSAPSIPTGLTASGITASQATLAWQASTDNIGVSGYRVYRDGAVVGTTSDTRFTSAGLAANTSYAFTVAAFDSAGNASAQPPSLAVTTSPTAGASYTTNFDKNENPISEGGAWHRAKNSWTDVQTAGGVAFGTNGVTNSYDDSYALLSGFGPDQTAQGVIYRDTSLSANTSHEVELLLRASDDATHVRGYECLFNYAGGIQIVRWNGDFGNFTVLQVFDAVSLARELMTGDVIKASMVGSEIRVYINDTLMGRAVDTTFSTGQPGMAFFIRAGGHQRLLGLTSYIATSP